MFNSNKYLINTPDQKRKRDDFSDYESRSDIADSFMRSISIYVDAKSWAAVFHERNSQLPDDDTRNRIAEQEKRAELYYNDALKKLKRLVQ